MLSIPKRFFDKPISIQATDGTWMCTGKATIKSFSDYHVIVEDAVEVMLIPWTSIKKIYFSKKKDSIVAAEVCLASIANILHDNKECEGCGDPVE